MTERRDIWKAHEDDGLWNETVLAYALAFGELAKPKPNRPASWDLTYQAAVHDMNPLPPRGDLRAQCQHDTWFFLPWHRMYLLHFEAVIRAIILDLPAGPISDEARETPGPCRTGTTGRRPTACSPRRFGRQRCPMARPTRWPGPTGFGRCNKARSASPMRRSSSPAGGTNRCSPCPAPHRSVAQTRRARATARSTLEAPGPSR